MNSRNFKPLALALAVTVALAACQASDAPETTAVETAGESAAPAIDMSAIKAPMIALQAADLDTSVQACTDLDQFVNGKWLAANPVPADRTTWGSFEALAERSLEIQHALVQSLAAREGADGTAKLIGDIWATGMDEASIEAAGLAPIQPGPRKNEVCWPRNSIQVCCSLCAEGDWSASAAMSITTGPSVGIRSNSPSDSHTDCCTRPVTRNGVRSCVRRRWILLIRRASLYHGGAFRSVARRCATCRHRPLP